jgi:hypothetical protein
MIIFLLKKLSLIVYMAVMLFSLFLINDLHWLCLFVVCGSSVVWGALTLWIHLKKIPTVQFMNGLVIVNGTKIQRSNITGWRVFRGSNQGDRVRYLEIQLKRQVMGPVRWWLVKLFEPVSSAGSSVRVLPFAKEPRLIALLNRWDLTQSEMAELFTASESFGTSPPC